MSTQHTPGPWKVRKHWADPVCFEVYPTRGKKPAAGQWSAIAEVGNNLAKGESARANARLIAAAPQQHDALLSVLHAPGFDALDDATKNAVRAAIAAAAGSAQ